MPTATDVPANGSHRVALDAMSGDLGHAVVVEAGLLALRANPSLSLILVGDEARLRADCAPHLGTFGDRIRIVHASEVVGMDDKPSKALRGKRDSSMRVAINLVKEGQADACVSAGNTGALMAIARFVLKTLAGVDRPAIVSAIPSKNGHTHVLDLGANAACTAENLFEFAVMGTVLAQAVHGLASPKVGLLNIGEEEIKGNEAVKEAAALIQDEPRINYRGFVEGDDICMGDCDVIVCDGFSGNVALKSGEGVARLIRDIIKEEFTRSLWTRAIAAAAMPVLRRFGRRIDPGNYNGASLIGLRGVVIKSHGNADANAFANAIGVASAEVANDVPNRINALLEDMLSHRSDEMHAHEDATIGH